MFSDLIIRNSKRSRKENALFFGSMVITIVAFYMILAISTQDVMTFLRQMESIAVNRLMTMIPLFYGITLIILFFLIYFAYKYQFDRRRHEFGVYLMMGMRRGKLFGMLLAEDIISSFFALIIGIPVAVLLSETISLVTARTVGLGIIGHRFSFSVSAFVWTLIGFMGVKLLAILIQSVKISREDIGKLLDQPADIQTPQRKKSVYIASLIAGILMLAVAYAMAIIGLSWKTLVFMGITLIFGLGGTILLFYGLRSIIEKIATKGKNSEKLHVFTFRQIEENIIKKSSSLAVSSLLILAALCCFGTGIGISTSHLSTADHVIDYTFYDYESDNPEEMLPRVKTILVRNELADKFSDIFEMKIGYIRTTDDYENAFKMDSVLDALQQMPHSEETDILINNLGYQTSPCLICLSDYNHLLSLAGKEELNLNTDELGVYIDSNLISSGNREVMDDILSGSPEVNLDGNTFRLTGQVQDTNLVTDRAITLLFALIVPDEWYEYYTQGQSSIYVNAVLSEQVREENAIMNTYSDINATLNASHIDYDSYLQNIGRDLFYAVASSYITIYLAIVFLVVANTIIGVQFLMSQQKNGRRYRTLIRLGATYESLCKSAGKQIMWFLGLPVLVAALGSVFGVRSLFTEVQAGGYISSYSKFFVVAGAVIVLLCVVEFIYLKVIKSSSDKYLLSLMNLQREE